MLIEPSLRHHPETKLRKAFPSVHLDCRVAWRSFKCYQGNFGYVIAQQLPRRAYEATLYHLFLDSHVHLKAVLHRATHLLLYNHGPALPLRWGTGDPEIDTGSLQLLARDKGEFPIALEKGTYHFFMVDGEDLPPVAILHHPELSKLVFSKIKQSLIPYLAY